MAFEFPEKWSDCAAALRELEPQAPKGLKALMIQAANELDNWKRVAQDAARMLEEASNLRTGQMASQSRVDEVQRQVHLTMTDIASRFRELA